MRLVCHPHPTSPNLHPENLFLLGGGSGFPGLGSSQLSRLVSLNGALGLLNGRDTGNGILSDIWPVVVLSSRGNNGSSNLAGGLVPPEDGPVDHGGRLVGNLIVGLLGEENNGVLLAWVDTNGLLIDGSSVLAAVNVPQVQWITGEDDVVSTDGPLDEVGGLLADDLPEKVTRDVVDFGHCTYLVGYTTDSGSR